MATSYANEDGLIGFVILGLDVGHIDHMLATCAVVTQSTIL
jgi:hypothetical protein